MYSFRLSGHAEPVDKTALCVSKFLLMFMYFFILQAVFVELQVTRGGPEDRQDDGSICITLLSL